MPALGEAFHMIRTKCGERSKEVLEELIRLIDAGIVTIRYIRDAGDTFGFARDLSRECEDERDMISAMDALITAIAASDPDCRVLYTTDSKLLTDSHVSETLAAFREERRSPAMSIRDVSDLLKI